MGNTGIFHCVVQRNNRPFFQIKKMSELAIDTLIVLIESDGQIFHGVLRHHSFMYKLQNNSTNKQLRMSKH